MSHARSQIAAIGFIVVWSLHALAADLKIVANPSVKADSISASELRSVFLAERDSLSDGSHVEPVFERAGAVHETFLREFLKESNESLQSHYGALVFTGKVAMPKSLNSDAEVVAYVAKTRGAIGYISSSASSEGVKVLEVVSETSRSGHAPATRALLSQVQPEYPDTLRQLGISGIVRLQVVVSPQGNVEDVSVLGGNPILGESAMKAVRQWTYVAAPKTTTLIISVPFGTH
jgi:TonB family protein